MLLGIERSWRGEEHTGEILGGGREIEEKKQTNLHPSMRLFSLFLMLWKRMEEGEKVQQFI